MTTLIVLPTAPELTLEQVARFVDDLYEAIDYEAKHGFVTRVALERFKDGRPVYAKLPDEELAYIEVVNMEVASGVR